MPQYKIDPLTIVLFVSLLIALSVSTVTDLRARRIPNFITLSMMLIALLVHGLLSGFAGVLFSLQGIACGMGLLLIPHLLGGMGAGDVKLLAAVGAALGAAHTFYAFLVIAILGGLTSIVMLIIRSTCLITLQRMGNAFLAAFGGVGAAALRVDRSTLQREGIPYGAVIAGGTLAYILYHLIAGKGLPPVGI
ncbi:A24 family peptidase [Desulfotalea psychrophila]|uniref:Prepilin type IV endopeptidase peptidase domain-containing protein n=1 Tax=Desulfotalea psychrophila (strain LSv54 / DSM 12343) TaxID=177439 RepID=Q6AN08_DESPS|nr:prepilin peptidase [Desulfotalea psychrophila]CAG36266.1 unknown protein [Desulfotalea psychrophila LSv54]